MPNPQIVGALENYHLPLVGRAIAYTGQTVSLSPFEGEREKG
jgi:hypothetical protein